MPHGRSNDRGADSVDERARIGQSVALGRRAEVVDGLRLGPLDLLDEPDVTAETPEAEDVAQAHPRLAAVPTLVRQGAADDDFQGFVASTKRLSRSRLSSSTISGKWLAVCRYARCRDLLEAGLAEQLLGEVRREERARVAVPDELHDQLAAEVVRTPRRGRGSNRGRPAGRRRSPLSRSGSASRRTPPGLSTRRSSSSTGTRSR